MIMNVEVRPEIARQGNGSDELAQPPHNFRACAWVRRNDKDGLSQD